MRCCIRGWLHRLGWCLLLLLGGAGCDARPKTPTALDLPVYFTADINGRLVPCGCFSGQHGGMTRLRTVLEAEANAAGLRVDVGDALSGTADFEVIQYRYQLQAFGDLHYDALNLGHREAGLSAAQLRELAGKSPVPLVSANLLDAATRQPVVAPYRIVERGGFKIAVVGVLDAVGLEDRLGAGLVVEPMETALGVLLPKVRPQVDLIVLLAFTDEPGMTRLAQQFYELNVILGGRVRQPAQELKRENRSVIYFTTNESRALGFLVLLLQGPSDFSVQGNEIRLLHDRIPEAEAVVALAKAYRAEVRTARLALDDPERLQADQVPGVRTAASYVGSESCLTCHPEAAVKWKDSGHAHAFETLARVDADADPRCLSCHTVGFGTPTGYRRELGAARLTQVGCESCHGPGSLHVRQYQGDTSVSFKFRPLGEGDCRKCHYGEFSRPFDWATFWPKVAHGAKAVPPAQP